MAGEASLLLLLLVSASVSSVPQEQRPKYIQLDHDLVPKDISNIQIVDKDNEKAKCTQWWRPRNESRNIKAKYEKNNSGFIIQEYVKFRGEKKSGDDDYYDTEPARNPSSDEEEDILSKDLEKVIGTDVPNVYFDEDWGLFSSVLASYNNHWALRTGPEDWWTVVLRKVAQEVADKGDNPKVRDLFVEHQGKKEININVGGSLSNLDYSWLFDQFSGAIRNNIKVDNYVDVIESDFTSTTRDKKIISQVMLMSSLKKYFSYGFFTSCGIPGVYMKGTRDDWVKLIQKLNDLEAILEPVKEELKKLSKWFDEAKTVFNNLLKTYNGDETQYRYCPYRDFCNETTRAEWWGKILSWKEDYGSGSRPHWEGWFPKFLGANNRQPYKADDFPSGLVTVAINIADKNNSPAVEDKGVFVAGTLGFTVEESEMQNGAPVVEPNQIWNLLLPKCSPVTPRLKGTLPNPRCTPSPSRSPSPRSEDDIFKEGNQKL